MRSLAYGPYSHWQVYDRLHDDNLRFRSRFDLLDAGRVKIGELDTVYREERTCLVEHNIDQGVKGSLDLKMDPDERLRGQCYQRFVKPWFGFDMPDGGWVDFPWGVYVWNIPDTDLGDAGLEEWSAVLPDQLDILNTQSPHPYIGYWVSQGDLITDAIKDILTRNGITDHSRIEWSPVRFDQNREWGLWEPKDPAWEEYRRLKSLMRYSGPQVEFVQSGPDEAPPHGWQATSGGLAAYFAAINAEKMEATGFYGPFEVGAVTWLSILERMHKSLAWFPPHFDHDGRYVGRSGLQPDALRPDRTLHYTPKPDSIMRGLKTSVDLAKFANAVIVSATNPDGLYVQHGVTAEMLMPDHPLSATRIGRQQLHFETESSSDNSDVVYGMAVMRLFEFLNTTDKAQWTTFCNPAHEPYDFLMLGSPRHPDLAQPQLYHEHMYVLDLATGDMEHGGYRAYLKEPWFGLVGYEGTL